MTTLWKETPNGGSRFTSLDSDTIAPSEESMSPTAANDGSQNLTAASVSETVRGILPGEGSQFLSKRIRVTRRDFFASEISVARHKEQELPLKEL